MLSRTRPAFLALLASAALARPQAAPTPQGPEAAPPSFSPAAAPAPGDHGVAPRAGLKLPEIRLHDPWILADAASRTYYLYSSAPARLTPEKRTGTLYYRSKDLAAWEGPFLAFVVPADSWADPKENAWAPEVHAYSGKYYLFTTLHNPRTDLPTPPFSRPRVLRSTIIAVADAPTGPFRMLKAGAPTVSGRFMVLDGTLFVDTAGKPWMVYAHEWLQKNDGTIEALPLAPDLSAAAGEPVHLFKGSDAPWINEQTRPDDQPRVYVTDGPELFRTKDGHLLMLWSSYEKNAAGRDTYVQTVARSKSGELQGPWEQLPPLVRNDSGHGMLFRTFQGQLMLVLHQPFLNARAKLYEVEDRGDHLEVTRYREDLSGPPLGPQPGQ